MSGDPSGDDAEPTGAPLRAHDPQSGAQADGAQTQGGAGQTDAGAAVRLRVPDEGHTTVRDVIRGESAFENRLLDDFVIARADRSAPRYALTRWKRTL